MCKYCGSITTNPSYCSRSCANTASNLRKPKRKAMERKCKRCSSLITDFTSRRSKLCISCRPTLGKLTLGEVQSSLLVAGKHPSWKNTRVREHNRRVNKELLRGGCKVCGYITHVELAHLRPVRSFPLDATLDQVNSRDNVVALCPNHHWEFDSGLLQDSLSS